MRGEVYYFVGAIKMQILHLNIGVTIHSKYLTIWLFLEMLVNDVNEKFKSVVIWS